MGMGSSNYSGFPNCFSFNFGTPSKSLGYLLEYQLGLAQQLILQ